MIYFEDARVEFFGVPLDVCAVHVAPDPSVKRKSGFLFPTITYDLAIRPVGVEIPYFWALAPNYDLTMSTTTDDAKQGELFQGIWRQRLLDGSYSIKAAGIFQLDPTYFANRDGPDSPTARSFRGVIQTAGQFALTDKWVWGWTGLLMTDTQFLYDYQLTNSSARSIPFQTGIASEGVSQLYLTGAGDRSYFDIRSIYYYGFSEQDIQARFRSSIRFSTIRTCSSSRCWAANSATSST
jgi:LPS-assembly protein